MKLQPKGKTFTQLELDNLRHRSKLIEPGALGSILGDCRISQRTGKRSITWTYRYTSPTTKKEREIGCGTWPKIPMRDIRAARDAHALKVKGGIDPLEAKEAAGIEVQRQIEAERAEQAAAAAELTPVNDLLDAWLKDGVLHRDGNKNLEGQLDNHVRDRIGATPVKQLTEHDIRDVLRPIAQDGKNRTAIVVHATLSSAFKWAEDRQPWRRLLIEGNPIKLVDVRKIVDPDYSEYRERRLSKVEIKELSTILETIRADYTATPAGQKYGAKRPIKETVECAIWIMLSTLCRVGELSMAEWRYVDFDARTWFIPKAHVKAVRGNVHKEITINLSDFALVAMRRLHKLTSNTPYLFPSADKLSSIDEKAITKQIGDRQIRFSKSKNRKTRRQADNTLVLANGRNGKWTPHDLRRTGANIMMDLDVDLNVIDFCQNHVLEGSKTRRHYLHSKMKRQMKEAWDTLGQHLESVLKSTKINSPKHIEVH